MHATQADTGTHTAPRLAAPAPQCEEDQEDRTAAAELEGQPDLHTLCERWAVWVRTRKLFVAPSLPPSLLGRLASKGTGRGGEGPDAMLSAELSAFHMAYLSQPTESLDRKAFELHYYWRVRHIRVAALELGISRQHWYRLVADFRIRTYRQSLQVLAINHAAYAALPSVAQGSAPSPQP
jgi:hypothetical protein